ncbi:MAG: hypothetical protein ACI8XZ_005561, partial [Gammaproteobacteria bacterium]
GRLSHIGQTGRSIQAGDQWDQGVACDVTNRNLKPKGVFASRGTL